MSKHTKGPWRLSEMPDGRGWYLRGAEDAFIETIYRRPLDDSGSDEANASLMAASPDLKEALERYVALDVQADKDEGVSIRCDSGLHRAAVAALKKATGGEA
jgi:hypothetical protein